MGIFCSIFFKNQSSTKQKESSFRGTNKNESVIIFGEDKPSFHTSIENFRIIREKFKQCNIDCEIIRYATHSKILKLCMVSKGYIRIEVGYLYPKFTILDMKKGKGWIMLSLSHNNESQTLVISNDCDQICLIPDTDSSGNKIRSFASFMLTMTDVKNVSQRQNLFRQPDLILSFVDGLVQDKLFRLAVPWNLKWVNIEKSDPLYRLGIREKSTDEMWYKLSDGFTYKRYRNIPTVREIDLSKTLFSEKPS